MLEITHSAEISLYCYYYLFPLLTNQEREFQTELKKEGGPLSYLVFHIDTVFSAEIKLKLF